MLASLFVVFLVESSNQFLEDRAHAVVVEAGMPDRTVGIPHWGGTQVNVGRREFFDQRSQSISLGKLLVSGFGTRNCQGYLARWGRTR